MKGGTPLEHRRVLARTDLTASALLSELIKLPSVTYGELHRLAKCAFRSNASLVRRFSWSSRWESLVRASDQEKPIHKTWRSAGETTKLRQWTYQKLLGHTKVDALSLNLNHNEFWPFYLSGYLLMVYISLFAYHFRFSVEKNLQALVGVGTTIMLFTAGHVGSENLQPRKFLGYAECTTFQTRTIYDSSSSSSSSPSSSASLSASFLGIISYRCIFCESSLRVLLERNYSSKQKFNLCLLFASSDFSKASRTRDH